ncbi:hypothetical protein AVEN_6232-1 [Araneus ventricosus]|uniref:Uncharacterized protein n=1 Tax=Araneus ventricosus TaxID=182803 RepID=A0A4Y2GPH0_ARAVE|nr:hypothetical protein AVEN_6232-1 [Araneus ventricosus]
MNAPACFSIVPFFLPADDGLFLQHTLYMVYTRCADGHGRSHDRMWLVSHCGSKRGNSGIVQIFSLRWIPAEALSSCATSGHSAVGDTVLL